MNHKRAIGAGMGMLAAMILSACGSSALEIDMSVPMADGTYTGTSEEDDQGAVGQVEITVEGGKITNTVYSTLQKDGSLKDENYGKGKSGAISNDDYYNSAQRAVESFKTYSKELTSTNNPNEVDVISGATVAHQQFIQAAIRAIFAAQGVEDKGVSDKIDIPDIGNGGNNSDSDDEGL